MTDEIRVLYVDDEESLLHIGKIFLERQSGLKVDTSISATQALHLLEKTRFDVIVSDYMMPRMDGIEFLKKIHTLHLDIPFILFTGRGREEVAIEAINNGADFYLQKGGDPKVQFAELDHKIHQAVARKRTEHELIESKKQLSDIINFLPDATFAINRDGIIISWNRAIEDLTGLSADQMLGKGNYEYALPFYGERRKILIDLIFESEDKIAQRYSHIIRQKDQLIAETTLNLQERGRATFALKASTLYDSSGEIVGAIESIRDITEQKQAEEKLHNAYEQIAQREEELHSQLEMLAESEKKTRESETKFRSIFEKSLDAFMLTEDGRLVDCNEKALHLFGYHDYEEMKDMQSFEASPKFQPDGEDSKTGAEKHIQKAFELGEDKFEWIHKRKDGSTFPAEVLLFSFEINGKKYLQSSIRDITERKLAEIAIQENEENYRNVIEYSPFGMHFYELLDNGDLIFTGANPAADTILGMDHSLLIGKPLEEAFPGLVDTQIPKKYRQIAKEGGFWHDEQTYSDSGEIHGSYTMQVFQIQPGIIVAAFFDITELKRAENALKESEEKYRKLFEESNDAIFIADTTTRKFTDCNRKAELLTGYSKETILSMVVDELHPEDLRPEIIHAFKKFVDGYTESIESCILTREGSAVPVSINASVVVIGTKKYLIGITRDLTLQKEIENAFREKTIEVDKFFNISLDLFCIADTNGIFHRLNPEWEKTLGYNLSELMGKRFLDFVHPDDIQKTIDQVSDLRDQKEVVNFVNRYRHKDGTYRWIEWRSVPRGERIFAAARDITHHYLEEYYMAGLNSLKQDLLVMQSLDEKLKKITECSKTLFNADCARIWIAKPGDRCNEGCNYSKPPDTSCDISVSCLHLVADSEKDTCLTRKDDRIPFGVSIIGKIATGTSPSIIIPDVSNSPPELESDLTGMPEHTSFAGFRLLSSDGNLLGVLGMFSSEEINEEKSVFLHNLASTTSQVIQTSQAEDALRESEEKFRQLITLAPVPFCLVTSGDMIEYCNERFVKTFGYTVDDIPTLHNWWERAYPDEVYRQEVMNNWISRVKEASKEGGDIESSEYYITCKDGTTKNVLIGGIAIENMYLAAFIDITEQRQAEEALRDSESRYRTIIENMQDAFFRIDKNSRIIMISGSAARMLGYGSEDELLGLSVLSIWHNPDDRKRFIKTMKENNNVVHDYEADFVKKDGTRFPISMSAHINYDSQGNFTGTEGLVRDITERKKVEEALLLTNKKLNLLSSITRHDINNQLQILLGYLEISKSYLSEPSELKSVIATEERVAHTIARQIRFTKDYENMGVALPLWQNVALIIADVIKDLPIRDISITVEEKTLEIFADPLLEKVFYNLIENALKYGGDTMTEIRIFSRQERNSLYLFVKDNGSGVTPDDKLQLFTKGFGKNTGLGLFLSKEILTITGISITENGIFGEGAQFEILVPEGGFRILRMKNT